MSLTVPAALLEKAQHGSVPDEEFVDCIAGSLPYAWGMVERLAHEMDVSGAVSAEFTSPRAQLLDQRPELLNC